MPQQQQQDVVSLLRRLNAGEQLSEAELQVVLSVPEEQRAALREAAAQGATEAPEQAAPRTGEQGFQESFSRTQPFQLPDLASMAEVPPGDVAAAMAGQQLGTLAAGAQALFPMPGEPLDIGSRAIRALNIPAAHVPGIGPAISQEIIEPFAQASTFGENPEREFDLGSAAGGAAGFGLEAMLDRGLGGVFRGARNAVRGVSARQAIDRDTPSVAQGEMLSAGQRPDASGLTVFTEALTGQLPGGRRVTTGFREMARRNLVENGVNRVLATMGNFAGSRADMLNRVGRSVEEITRGLTEQNQQLYGVFDEALFAHNQQLGMRAPANRAQAAARSVVDNPAGRTPAEVQAARNLAPPGEVTAIVPASQAGASVPGAAPSGVRVTSTFVGDTVADVADQLIQQVGAQQLLVRDDSLSGLVSRVEALRQVRGRAIPVTVATKARGTLLSLARRLDNPLGSQELHVVDQVFKPIDAAIEQTLREVGGSELVGQWRTANAGAKRAHRLVDETLFNQVLDAGSPEQIAALFDGANVVDLSQMKARLPAEQWDQVRTLIIRDRLARSAITGESVSVARGGANPTGPGNPLRVDLDADSPVRVSGINEAISKIDESVRGVLLDDDELRAIAQLDAISGRVGNINEAIGKLVGSGLAASTILGAGAVMTGAFGGFMAGGGPGAGIGAAAALPTMVVGSRALSELFTRPELLDMITMSLSGGARAGLDSAFVGTQVVNSLSDEALAEFVAENNIPPDQLPPSIRQRLFGGPQTLMDAFNLQRMGAGR